MAAGKLTVCDNIHPRRIIDLFIAGQPMLASLTPHASRLTRRDQTSCRRDEERKNPREMTLEGLLTDRRAEPTSGPVGRRQP